MRDSMAEIPDSIKPELQAWNNGAGIDLEGWVGCEGRFALAVGYASLFCPDFVEFEDYIFIGADLGPDAIQNIRGFESGADSTPRSVEWVMNHLHIADIQYRGCPDISPDKLLAIGNALKKIYEARLAYLFPQKPCTVEFYVPSDPSKVDEYQISFWQIKHE